MAVLTIVMNKLRRNRRFLYGLLVFLGVLYWCFDSVLSYVSYERNLNSLLSMGPGSFLDTFFLKVSPYQTIYRLAVLLLLLLGGTLLIELSNRKRKVANALVESEKRYQHLTNQVDVGTCIFQNERIITPNLKLQEITGFTETELENLKFIDIVHPDDIEKVLGWYSVGIAPGNWVTDTSFQILAKDGGTQLVYLDITPTVWQGKIGQLSVFHDVGNGRTKEKRRQQEKKVERIGLLAGGVAHDLNNILSGIVSYPELLLQMLPPDSPLCSHVETMHDAGLMASAVVSDFMTVARGATAIRHVADLNVLAEDFQTTPEYHILKERHPEIQLSVSFHDGPLAFLCSEVHIQKSVMNLVLNAFEAIGQGRGKVLLSTDWQNLSEKEGETLNLKAGPYAVLSVADTGAGISEEQKEHIFEPFYTRKIMGRSGTGLGLTVVWNTIVDHEGAIDINSSEGGTRFSLYLKLTQIPNPENSKRENHSTWSPHCR